LKKFNKILFATDLTEFSEYVFDYALAMAKVFNAKLIILHVINQPLGLQDYYAPEISFDTIMEEVKKSAEKMLEEFCEKIYKNIAITRSLLLRGYRI
jgi:nucleotide-binding universal stress UspA family protein